MTVKSPARRPQVISSWHAWCLALALLNAAAAHSPAATFVVTNTLDSGNGSLRQALLDANATPGADTIVFQISGTGTRTIAPVSALPPVSDPVEIDGTTQPGFAGVPLIELNGASAGTTSVGLRLASSNSVVRGLVINRFGGGGLRIEGAGSNLVQGNFIGTDATGTIAPPNGAQGQGILVYSSRGNVIGGPNPGEGNLISGNGDAGVYFIRGSSNAVLGNYIGTTLAGAARLANGNNGITLYGSSSNVIGGTAAGARNVIAGNTGSGVYVTDAGAAGNLIQGNYIGLSANGSSALSNTVDGITLAGAPANLVGGPGAGNVISGNARAGISFGSAGATNNLVQGDYIGTTASGLQALGNGLAGISMNSVSGNVIGGTNAGAGNVISGNRQDGLYLTNSSGIVVQGNYIGVDVTGAGALSNSYSGITINGGTSNVVGGTVPGARNLISGNNNYGVYLPGGVTGHQIVGNYIGTDATGHLGLGNMLSGLRIESAGNIIGGPANGAGNLISGNGNDGILVIGAAATNNLIAGNYIGTDASGAGALPNAWSGIGLSDASANTIGGAAGRAGNLVSANGNVGIYLMGKGSTRNVIQGNTIGADVMGTLPLGNYNEGIYVQDGSTNTIGGTASGAGNLISANGSRGIWLTNASRNVIQGNWIGTKKDGTSPLGNAYHGLECEVGANNNLIGGPGTAGNRIAFAKTIYAGVRVRDGSLNNAILGNQIFSNGALGIDLGAFGVTTNDLKDGDSGANQLQNYPVLSQAVILPGGVTGVRGTLNSRPSSTFLLQFFANQTGDPSGYGEGQIYLGDKTVITGTDGNASFLAYFTNAFPAGYVITATATDAANNTSEFSAGARLLPMPTLAGINASVRGDNTLAITNMPCISWTNSATFVLKETTNLIAPVWVTSRDVPVLTSSNWWTLLLTNPPQNKYYKLSFE